MFVRIHAIQYDRRIMRQNPKKSGKTMPSPFKKMPSYCGAIEKSQIKMVGFQVKPKSGYTALPGSELRSIDTSTKLGGHQ